MRPRILAVGPASRPTSYARVLTSLLHPLKDRYDIHQLGIGRDDGRSRPPWPLHLNRPADVYAARRLAELVVELRPDVLLVVYDSWLYAAAYRHLLRERFPSLPLVLYCPVDGEDADPDYLRGLAAVDCLTVFTRFARRVIEESMPSPPPLAVIPHGLDTGTFHPLAEVRDGTPDRDASRVAARLRLFPDRRDLEDAFIVLNGNHDNPRKRVDLTIEAFARFARGKPPRVKLFLLAGLLAEGSRILPLARSLGIEERLLWIGDGRRSGDLSDAQLNLVYNACEVGVNTSIGEGWGLVAFEHAAAGGVQVLPRHSVHQELWEGAAELVAAGRPVRGGREFRTHRLVDVDGVAEALERLYADAGHRRRRSLDAFRRATDPRLAWSRLAEDWDRLFQAVLAGPRRNLLPPPSYYRSRCGGRA